MAGEITAPESERANIADRVFIARGRPVILDSDLAELYGTTTSKFNQQVRRNLDLFEEPIAFTLTADEAKALQSQNVIAKPKRGGRTNLPMVFTDHGTVAAATVLKSPRARATMRLVIEVFLAAQKQMLSGAAAPPKSPPKILDQIASLGRKLIDMTLGEDDATTIRSELSKLPAAGARYVQAKLDEPVRKNERDSAEAEKLRAEARKFDAEAYRAYAEARRADVQTLRDLIEIYRIEQSGSVAPMLETVDALHALPGRNLIDITPLAPEQSEKK